MIDQETQSSNRSQHALLLIGSIGPLGHAPASGTVTVAVLGPVLFWLVNGWSLALHLTAVIVVTVAAFWIHQIGDRILDEKDSRQLVWDEIVGFFIAITLIPFTWQTVVAAILIERAIDIVKVPPANWVERRWPGGWGVVGDDVVAGIYTCAILHVAIRVCPGWLGIAG